ncbi:MAG: glycosyltransferase family 39 protein [Thermodesulfobacteriota bacterium]
MSDDAGRLAPREALLCAALAALAAATHVPLMLLTAGGCDEWHILQIAANLLDGHVLYRDSNHVSGPGSFYGVAALFALFGERFVVGRVAMVALFAALVVAIYLLTRRLTGPLAATLAALWLIAFRLWTFPHFQMLHYATIGLVLIAFAVVVLHAERPPSTWRAAAAGLLTGLAFVTKQDSGGLGIFACMAALLFGCAVRWRATGARERFVAPAVALAAAAAAPFLFTCAYFAWQGVLGPYLWQTVYDPLIQHPAFLAGAGPKEGDYIGMPPLLPLLEQDPGVRSFLFSWMPGLPWDLYWRDILQSRLYRETAVVDLALKVFFRLPYVVLAIEAVSLALAWRALRRAPGRARGAAAQGAQLLWGAAMMAAFSKPRDWIHLAILLVPLVPIVARQLAAVAALLPRWPRRAYAGVLAAAGLAFAAVSLQLAREALATYTAPVSGARGTVWVRPEDAQSFGATVDALAATPPDRPVLVVPCLPVLTFLSERPTLTRFIWLWPRDAYLDRDQQIIAKLEERPDASVVYVLMHTPFAPRPQVVVPELFQYLAEHYEVVEVPARSPERMMCALAARRPPSSAGETIRLTDRLQQASAVRSRDGATEEVPVERVAGVATWPLTPRVLHVTPGSGGESRVTIPLDVPHGGRLVLRAGVNPDLWQSLGPFPVRLRVAIVEDGRRSEVLSVEKDVYRHPGDRLWTPLDLDLARWAGRRVDVELSTEALGWQPGGPGIAGFEDPRVELGPRPRQSLLDD